MKHKYTDSQLQAAIDEAFAKGYKAETHRFFLSPSSFYWDQEAPNRLDLIKSALAALPEPEPLTVDWKTRAERVEHERNGWSQMHGDMKVRAEKAEAELARVREACDRMSEQEVLSLSQLRPIAEAGDVPEGCVRYYAASADYAPSLNQWSEDTHFADIRLPESAAKPKPETFEAHGKTWNVHNKGDTLPCDGNILVEVIDGDIILNPVRAESWNWRSGHFRGWRYADEPTPEPLVTKPISLPTPHGAISPRDYFAGQALGGYCAATAHHSSPSQEILAGWAYQQADAMLAAREVQS